MPTRYFPALIFALGLLFASYLLADIALASRGSGRDKFPAAISKIMPGDGRRDDDATDD